MKKNVFPLLMVFAALLYLPCCMSCTAKSQPEPQPTPVNPDPQPEPEKPQEQEGPGKGTYTFTASTLKGTWKAGDQIYVHGSYGPAAQIFTLKDSDISADGKTASLYLDEVLEYKADPDYLYAAWPASAVIPEDGLMDASLTFKVANDNFAQAFLQGTDFEFHDAASAITFTVSGGFDHVIIAGAQRPGLRLKDSYSNSHSSEKTSFAKFASDGYPFREEALPASGHFTFWFPGGVSLKGGFILYFGKGDDWTATYTVSENTDVKSGRILNLGDITSAMEAYEGGKPSMPEVTDVTKYAVELNEMSGICVSADGSFLWGLGDKSELARITPEGKVLQKVPIYAGSSTLDSEGITINYDTGDILISGEPNVVYRIPAGKVDQIFAESKFKGVESIFKVTEGAKFGNSGLEGCTYYKDGLVYVGAQTGSYLYCCVVETGEVLWRKNLREMHGVITEIAGLSYDPLTDWLWVVDSESHRFFALTGDAEHMLGYYSLKTKSNEEAICVDHVHSCVWIGDDYGSTSYLYKYELSGLDDAILDK